MKSHVRLFENGDLIKFSHSIDYPDSLVGIVVGFDSKYCEYLVFCDNGISAVNPGYWSIRLLKEGNNGNHEKR